MSDWVSTSVEMPKLNQMVLLWVYDTYYVGSLQRDNNDELYWDLEDVYLYEEDMEYVKAWMPLPEPPVEEVQEE